MKVESGHEGRGVWVMCIKVSADGSQFSHEASFVGVWLKVACLVKDVLKPKRL